jgi:peptide chain release factor 3
MSVSTELSRRRTFAIISHPDAGKTTLTEKFLLFGGAIQTAGAVKSNKAQKTATSDFMEIERQRGISVATSVMGFDYQDCRVTILDTPGHRDFAEDTYRTLSAVDSVILVVDSVKGVEDQTRRLMEVCRLRNTPVMIFVNKLDRDGKPPFDLLDELEESLRIRVRPLTWPINQGRSFQGVYNLYSKELNLFRPAKTTRAEHVVAVHDLHAPELAAHLPAADVRQLREDVELVEGIYDPLDEVAYRRGELAPVFFGSASNNFGVQELLDTFVALAPAPSGQPAVSRFVRAEEPAFTGFVFKIHANLDPRHRDRIAFVRIVSGRFERHAFYLHTRLGRKLRFANPTTFLANDKSVVDEAWPGDIVGLYDSGQFAIGDTLTEGEPLVFQGIPRFAPEILREVVNEDPLKTKQLDKGIRELTEEGVAQLFTQQPGNRKIIGTVGELQFEVLAFRLEHEYGARCSFRPLSIFKAYWLEAESPAELRQFVARRTNSIAYDRDQRPVLLADSQWTVNALKQGNPAITFLAWNEPQEQVQQLTS